MNDADQTDSFPEEDGAEELLDEVLDTLSRYVAFASERQAHAITLWTAAPMPSGMASRDQAVRHQPDETVRQKPADGRRCGPEFQCK